MKLKEAPERLYLSKNIYSTFLYQTPDPDDETQVEYIRRDSVNSMLEMILRPTKRDIKIEILIEKACKFIKDHHHEYSFWNTEEYELEFNTQKFIDDFKNYIEGK